MKFQRLLGVSIVAVATLALGASAAGAVQYPPDSPSASVSASTVSAGGSTTVSGAGWQANSTVSCTLSPNSVSLGSATADGSGVFSMTVTIPAGTSSGAHTIVCTGTGADGNPATQEIAITVTVAGATAAALPRTGSDAPSVLLIGAGLLLVGAVLAVAARRRHNASITT